MCLLALMYRVVEDAPLVVGANREEFYARGGTPPRRLPGPIPAVGGIDPAAGGTWLGVNARRLVVAVTNRAKSSLPTQPRSRGLLVRDLLGCDHATQAQELGLRELETGHYAGCNLLCADAGHAAVIHAGDWLRVRLLPPGIHVLSNADLNDNTDARVVHALSWLSARPYRSSAECILALRQLCASNEPVGEPVCFRGPARGTVSSSILAVRPELGDSLYLHAQGPPDSVPYADLSGLLRDLSCSPPL
jgi:uncharacterized protein with NRDE domain